MQSLKIRNLIKLYGIFLAIIISFVIFFQVALLQLKLIPNFIDELILIFILIISVYRAGKDIVVKKLLIIYLGAYAFFFILSFDAISHRGISSVLLQIFIHLKYIVFVLFAWIFLGKRFSKKAIYIYFIITLAFLFINMMTGSYFNDIFEVITQKRGGWVRPIGIQANTGSLGSALALFCCFFICTLKQEYRKIKIFLLILFSIILILTTVRVALVVIPLIVLWWLKDSIKSFAIVTLISLFAFLFFKSSKLVDELVDITTKNIEWTVENPVESGYIRGIMIYFAIEIANEKFPIGTGAATYGTVTSDDSYVYAEIGLHNSRFFVDKEGIYDSNLASILGEFGYLGLLVYLYIFYRVVTLPNKLNLYQLPNEFQFVFISTVIISALVTPIFMNTFPAFIIGIVLVASYTPINIRRE